MNKQIKKERKKDRKNEKNQKNITLSIDFYAPI